MYQYSVAFARRCHSFRLGAGISTFPPVPSLLLPPALASSAPIRRLAFQVAYQKPKVLEGDKLIAEAVELHGDIAARKKKVNVSKYWNLNYQLTRWLNEEHPAAQKALELHKRSTAAHAGKYVTIDFKRNRSRNSVIKWGDLEGWQQLHRLSRLIGSLACSARDTLLVLRQEPPPPFYVQADCLYHLRNARWEEIKADPGLYVWFWNRVRQLKTGGSVWQERSVSNRHLELILQSQTKTEQREMLAVYEERYPDFSDSRLLFFIDCYTRLGDVDKALWFLRRVSPELLQRKDDEVPPQYSVVRRCMKLLQLETVESEGETYSFKVLPEILQLGVPPHDLMYSLVTSNAIRLKMPKVAWTVYRHASGQGIRVTPVVHRMLLKDSYLRQDTNALNEALSGIQELPNLSSNPLLVAYTMNVIRSICFYQQQSGPSEILTRILVVYDKFYSRSHLAIAGVIPEELAKLGDPELPNPDSLTLAFTIFFYIMVQRYQPVVNQTWERLKQCTEEGNEVILQAAGHPLFYDAFIGYYSREPRAVSKALGVLRYMLTTENCLPGEITWARVIGMLLRYEKEESAEKIWQIMLRRGSRVTEEPWAHFLERYPYTKIAQEVNQALALSLEAKKRHDEQPAYIRDSDGILETDTSAAAAEHADEGVNDLDDLDAVIDVTEKQVDQSYSNLEESGSQPIWVDGDEIFAAPLDLRQSTIEEEPSTLNTQVKDTIRSM